MLVKIKDKYYRFESVKRHKEFNIFCYKDYGWFNPEEWTSHGTLKFYISKAETCKDFEAKTDLDKEDAIFLNYFLIKTEHTKIDFGMDSYIIVVVE